MQIKLPYNEVTPLVKIDYSQIFDGLKKLLTPEEASIFAPRRAGFGGELQWDLPQDLQWTPVTHANAFDRNEALPLLSAIKADAAPKLGTKRELVEAVFSVPSPEYIYCARDAQGKIRVMLAAWGYRYPRVPAIDPLKWRPEGEQNVTLKFIENGVPSVTEIDMVFNSGYTKRFATDNNGEISLGTHQPGVKFNFVVPSRNRNFELLVEKGRDLYVYDLTVAPLPQPVPHKEETPTPPPMPAEEENISPEATIKFIGFGGHPIKQGEAQLLQNGMPVLVQGIAPDGTIHFGINDIPHFSPLTLRVTNTPVMLPDCNLQIEPDELQYEIHYHPAKRSNSNGWIAVLVCALITLAGFLALASTDVMGLDIF